MAILPQTVTEDSDSNEDEHPTSSQAAKAMNIGSKRFPESDSDISLSKKMKQNVHENPMDVEIE